MSKLIATQRLRSAAGDMHLALVKARSEAVKRNKDVTISPEGGNWAAGWSILDPEGEQRSMSGGPTSSVTLTTSATSVILRRDGPGSSAAPQFVFSSPGTDVERCISADLSGRPYVKEGSSC